ncbi:MAG: ZIP family metal transporter [Clostridiales bacterium]|jgi:ZIP family zinc transporter|nr:ZIP family metal transporter [Clostridiales bacterium]
MTDFITVAIGLLIPFAGTTLGAAMVFFIRGEMSDSLRRLMLGFASGVMIAASVWSLLIPAINMTEMSGGIGWVPAVIGFLAGVAFLLILDYIVPHLHRGTDIPEGRKTSLGKSTMMFLAVTLHNIPEGMATGVVFAGLLSKDASIPVAAAFALSIGIALQNFPEGTVLSVPMMANGITKKRAFLYGVASGIVEPIGAVLTITLTSIMLPILPYILSFAAGAMIYVVVDELIPEAQSGDHSNIGTIGAALGFALMMLLDIALG